MPAPIDLRDLVGAEVGGALPHLAIGRMESDATGVLRWLQTGALALDVNAACRLAVRSQWREQRIAVAFLLTDRRVSCEPFWAALWRPTMSCIQVIGALAIRDARFRSRATRVSQKLAPWIGTERGRDELRFAGRAHDSFEELLGRAAPGATSQWVARARERLAELRVDL